jgi:hypothetical protein
MAYALHWLATDPLRMTRASRARSRRFNTSVKQADAYFSRKAHAERVLSLARREPEASFYTVIQRDCFLWDESAYNRQAVAYWETLDWLEEWEEQWAPLPQYALSDVGAWVTSPVDEMPAEGPAVTWNTHFARTFREWTDSAKTIPQRQFWSFFAALTDKSAVSLAPQLICEGQSERDLLFLLPHHGSWQSSRAVADLSGRRIRRILVQLAKELERLDFQQFGGPIDLGKYLSILGQSLICKILAFVRLRVIARRKVHAIFASQTHDFVRIFVIHTGVSPPPRTVEHPAAGRMMSVNAESRRAPHVENRRRKTTRDLRNAFRRQRAQARGHRSAQGDAPADRSARLARRWSAGNHPAMAQRV